MEDREEYSKNLEATLNVLGMFNLTDILEALLLNDTEKLKEMREFFHAEVKKISEAKNLNDEDFKEFVCTFKRDRFSKNTIKKEYTSKDGEAKISWIQKRRGKK